MPFDQVLFRGRKNWKWIILQRAVIERTRSTNGLLTASGKVTKDEPVFGSNSIGLATNTEIRTLLMETQTGNHVGQYPQSRLRLRS